jgi:hypothetical protein
MKGADGAFFYGQFQSTIDFATAHNHNYDETGVQAHPAQNFR